MIDDWVLVALKEAADLYFHGHTDLDFRNWTEALTHVGINGTRAISCGNGVVAISCYGRNYKRLIP